MSLCARKLAWVHQQSVSSNLFDARMKCGGRPGSIALDTTSQEDEHRTSIIRSSDAQPQEHQHRRKPTAEVLKLALEAASCLALPLDRDSKSHSRMGNFISDPLEACCEPQSTKFEVSQPIRDVRLSERMLPARDGSMGGVGIVFVQDQKGDLYVQLLVKVGFG